MAATVPSPTCENVLRDTGVFELPVPAVKVRNIWDKFDEYLNLPEPRIVTQVERLVRCLVSWTLALRYHGR